MIPTTLVAVLALAAPQGAPAQVPLVNHKELRIATSRLATEYPDLLTVLPLGESREERAIEALRVAAGELVAGRPAILLVANLDGPWAWTSGLALHHVRRLAERYAEGDAAVRELLTTTTLYVVPRANPDAAEARFETPLVERYASGRDVDNDRDGRTGEDGPQDLDGDGRIAWMRVPDPEGEWLADPADERANRRADRDRGERGRWKVLREGRDDDGDDEVAEDPDRDAVVNRNFPHRWTEHDAHSGVFPTDEPEARALCDFVLAHPEIALVVTYGALDSVIEPGKPIADDARPVKRVPPTGTRRSDADALAELARRYKEATGSKAVTKPAPDRDGGAVARDGSFQAWCYQHRGLWTLDLVVWSLPLDAKAPAAAEPDAADGTRDADGAPDADTAPADSTGAPGAEGADGEPAADGDGEADASAASKPKTEPTDDAKRLRWIDRRAAEAEEEADPLARFLPWQPFEHPTLGPVEIGGFAPYATLEPPADALAELAPKELEFLVSLGAALPRVRVVDCTFRELGENLVRVEASIEADGLLPARSRSAELARTPRPIRVALELPAGARIYAGARERLVRKLPGAARRETLTWVVGAAGDEPFDPAALRVTADSDHAGTARAAPQPAR